MIQIKKVPHAIGQLVKRHALQIAGFFQKDFMLLLKRKKYFYLTLLFPLLLSIIYLFILSPQPAILDIGICNNDAAIDAKDVFDSIEHMEIHLYPQILCQEKNLTGIKDDIKQNKIIALVEIPSYFTENLQNYQSTKMDIYVDNTDLPLASLLRWRLDEAIRDYEHGIVNEANTHFKNRISEISTGLGVVNKYVDYLESSRLDPIEDDLKETNQALEKLENLDTYFLLNPIAMQQKPIYEIEETTSIGLAFIFPIIALFVTLMLASTNIIYDKSTNYIARLRASGASTFHYLIAKIGFFTFLTLIQFGVVILLFLINGSSFTIHWMGLIQTLLYISVMNALIGLLIGILSESEGIAVLLSLLLTLPFMFLSGIFSSIKIMPRFFQWIAQAFPLNTQIELLKQVMIFGNSAFASIWYPALVLGIVVLFLLKKVKI